MNVTAPKEKVSDVTPMTNIFDDIDDIITVLNSKFKTARDKFNISQTKINNTTAEIQRLRATVSSLKVCPKCEVLTTALKDAKKQLKKKEHSIAVLSKLVYQKNAESYAMTSQMVNDAIDIPAPEMNIDHHSEILNEDQSQILVDETMLNAIKTPTKMESPFRKSPVVRKRSKMELSFRTSKKVKGFDSYPEEEKKEVRSFVMALNQPPSPEILKDPEETIFIQESPVICETDVIKIEKPSPLPRVDENPKGNTETEKVKWDLKRSRILTLKGGDKLKQTVLSTAALEKKVDISTLADYNGGSATVKTEPMTNAVVSKPTTSFATSMPKLTVQTIVAKTSTTSAPVSLKPKEQTVSASKFISTNGAAKDTAQNKENNNTIFEPVITSTCIDDIHRSPNKTTIAEHNNLSPKIRSHEKSKIRTPEKNIEDSFDCVPSSSPRYKYKRDTVRKKADRMKLPGQKCDKCVHFYKNNRDIFNTQMLNKCSRHRDKYPIMNNSPPGLWNPLFDDTDEEDGK